MPIKTIVNDNGTLRTAVKVKVNDAGTLRNVNKIFINDNGTLRLVFAAVENTSYETSRTTTFDTTITTTTHLPNQLALLS